MSQEITLRITFLDDQDELYVPRLVEDLAHTLSRGQENVKVEWLNEYGENRYASLGVNGSRL